MPKEEQEIQRLKELLKESKTKHAAESTRLKKKINQLEKEAQYCYWKGIKYSVGAVHTENGIRYQWVNGGRWLD